MSKIVFKFCFNLQGTAGGWGLLQECKSSIFAELSITQKLIILTFKYFPVIDETLWTDFIVSIYCI